jgi:hypothetical protein
MAFEAANYLVTRDIALRSGFINTRHRTKDGYFILNDRDLSCVRFTVDEYVNGLSGVKKISKAEAKKLIRENNYAIGDITEGTETVATKSGENTETTNEETVKTESETSETEQEEE